MVTSPVRVKLRFTFVIPYRTAKEDGHALEEKEESVEMINYVLGGLN